MRKLMIPVVIASSLLATAPALAQSWQGDNRYVRQIDNLIERIQRAEDRDLISRREEARLMSEARQLNYVENRYSRNGLTRWEAQDLQRRVANLRAQFRWERNDRRYSSSRW